MIEHKRNVTDVGDVKVHNNAIKAITELTVSKINGIVRINRKPLKVVLDRLGIGKTLNIMDGIKVESTTSGTKVTLDIVTAYGADISEIAGKVQDQVKQAVENMTGISSVEVDVNVTGVESDQGGR